jgi:hypothetical protein
MKSDDSATIISELLARLPGATLDSWCDPGRRGSEIKPVEFQVAITSPRALAILADVAYNADVLLKVKVATHCSGRFDDPNRVRYTLCVPQENEIRAQPSPLHYTGSVLACRLRDCGLIARDEVDRLLQRWKTAIPTVDDLVRVLDQKAPGDLLQHWALHGFEALIPGLIAAYPRIKHWEGRNSILFDLIRYARKRPEVVDLALVGLLDSANMVRMQSCIMLAYSQRKDVIPYLEQALSHKDKKTRQYAREAINHIRNKTVFYDCTET